jgi:hypothetical protein
MDDILISSRTQREHVQHIERVLQLLGEAHFRIAPNKCEVGCSTIKYLGHVLSCGTIAEDPEKVTAITEYEVPRTVKSLRRFTAMCAYHRRFVPSFAAKAGPLYDVMREKKGTIMLGAKELRAVQQLKDAISSAPVLAKFEEGLPTRVETDASTWGVGAVLSQRSTSAKWKPVAFYSQRYSKTEGTLPARDLELLGVVKAITHFRKFVYGRPFEVITDHKGLTVAQAARCSTRGQRLLLKLEDYDFKISYRKGERNVVPDALSRQHEQEEDEEAPSPSTGRPRNEAAILLAEATWDGDFKFVIPDVEEWKAAGRSCRFCSPIIKMLTGDFSDSLSCRIGAKKAMDRHVITLKDGMLITEKGQRVVPELLRGRVMTLYHYTPFAAHLATAKMVPLLKEIFYWPELQEDVEALVASCLECRMAKSTPTQGAIAVRHLMPEPFAWLALDHVGPLPTSKNGNEYLFVCLDVFSSWVEAFPVKNTSAEVVASVLWKEVMARYGVPKVLLTDNGAAFRGRLVAALAQKLKIEQKFTSVRHPQANGGVERVNKTLNNA